MSIFVKGIKVRGDELKYDLKVDFIDLTESGQHRLFKKNKNLFLYDALTSQFPKIRELPFEFKNAYSAETLNEVLDKLIPKIPTQTCRNLETVLKLLKLPNLKLSEELKERMSQSIEYPLLFWIAKSYDISFNILKKMFFYECSNFLCYNYSELLDTIILNPNFSLNYNLDNEIETRFKAEHYYRIISHIKAVKNSKSI